MSSNPLVSICCITFNHAAFITKAIESFLAQNTDFDFEIIIHDDASTDGTTDIIKRYKEKFPDIFKLIIQPENQFSQGQRAFTSRFMFPIAQGKYIALCDGDDYWTDKNKLQKQINLLSNKPDYLYTFHKSFIQKGEKIVGIRPPTKSGVISLSNVLFRKTYPTMSLVFRKDTGCLTKLEKVINHFRTGDFALLLILASEGKGFLLSDNMGVYREHSMGVYSHLSEIKKLQTGIHNRRAALQHIPMNFKERMICRLMIVLRRFKIAGLRLGIFR